MKYHLSYICHNDVEQYTPTPLEAIHECQVQLETFEMQKEMKKR